MNPEILDAQIRASLKKTDLGEGAEPEALLAFRAGGLEDPSPVQEALEDSALARGMLLKLSEPLPAALEEWALQNSAQRSRKRLTLWISSAGGLLAAAAALIFLLMPSQNQPPEYRVLRLEGGIQALRGDLEESHNFGPDSPLLLILAPQSEEVRQAPHLRPFLLKEGAERGIQALSLEIQTQGAALRLEGEAQQIFREGFGRYQLLLAFAEEADRFSDLEGLSLKEAQGRSGLRWLSLSLEYHRP